MLLDARSCHRCASLSLAFRACFNPATTLRTCSETFSSSASQLSRYRPRQMTWVLKDQASGTRIYIMYIEEQNYRFFYLLPTSSAPTSSVVVATIGSQTPQMQSSRFSAQESSVIHWLRLVHSAISRTRIHVPSMRGRWTKEKSPLQQMGVCHDLIRPLLLQRVTFDMPSYLPRLFCCCCRWSSE